MAGQLAVGTPVKDAKVCLTAVLVLVVPAVLTMASIDEPRPKMAFDANAPNPSPLGYTISLSLFIVPSLVLAWWFLTHPSYKFQKRVFWTTIAILAPLGFGLDFLFAETFFNFVNKGATLGIMVPVRGGAVPIEEFAFYLSGFIATLLFYIWCDEYWCGAYNIADPLAQAKALGIKKILHFNLGPMIVGAILLAPAFVYEEFFSKDPAGFPGYACFLLLTAILPSIVLFRTVKYFINWRAVSMTATVLLLISLLWEATLALPYHWWGYDDEQMIGLTVWSWSKLPIEATLVWLCVTFTTVLVYETVSLFFTVNAAKAVGDWPSRSEA